MFFMPTNDPTVRILLVEFHLGAISRPATRGPFLTRTGFRIFGRTQQLRFYRQVCRRIKRLTEAQLETNRATAG